MWNWTPQVSATTYSEIAAYRWRYATFFDDIATDIDEFVSTGAMSRARALASLTRQHLNYNNYPLFFTGDLDASLVLVHLNPKQLDDSSERFHGPFSVKTFEGDFDVCRHFGERMYGAGTPRTHKSPFDHKQIRLVRLFGVIEFVEGDTEEAVFTNLERVIDQKLQLELIPYGSDHFTAGAFLPSVLAPYLERILRVLTAHPRRYVLFCGAVFGPLLQDFIIDRHRFTLRKNDGMPEQMKSEFANLSITFDGGQVRAGWCKSWARQGIPMVAYANEVLRRDDA